MQDMDLSKKTRVELRALGEELGLKSLSALRKDELIKKITQYYEQARGQQENKTENTVAEEKKSSYKRTPAYEKKYSGERNSSYEKNHSGERTSSYGRKNTYERNFAEERESANVRKPEHYERRSANPESRSTYGDAANISRSRENSYRHGAVSPASTHRYGDDDRKQTPIPRRISGDEAKAAYTAHEEESRQTDTGRHFETSFPENRDSRQSVVRSRPDDVVEVCGILDVMTDGYGFLRFENYRPGKNDVYVAPSQIRRFRLKTGDEILGDMRPSVDEDKYSPLLYIRAINGDSIDVALHRRPFERLTPIYPTEKLSLDTGGKDNVTARLIDIIAPIGKGQRGMIVAPPKAGKTTIIKQLAQAITTNNPEVKLIVLLIDERPEEVTDMQRSVNGEIVYSTFDQPAESHCKSAEMVLERAMRLVEHKKDVVILIDSITRLARAYNQTIIPTGRTLSGGIDSEALYKPKKFFGAARNIEEGGSLTVIATALVETGSRMDDVVFEEFKGTGNMEIKLDRSLQERRVFPAIDILKSSTRREEDLLTPLELETSRILRRELSHSSFAESVAGIIKTLSNTKNNTEFCNFMINTYKGKN